MPKRLSIKLLRTSVFDADDYGPDFERWLDRRVGGKQGWMQPRYQHRKGKIRGTTIVVQRHEDGPEFWFNAANLALNAGSVLISAITLWCTTIPKREKEENGERSAEIRTPHWEVRIRAKGPSAPTAKQLAAILKVLSR